MSQGLLGFQYEDKKTDRGLTALDRLPVYLEFSHVMGLIGHFRSRPEIGDDDEGWNGDRVIKQLVWINLAGRLCGCPLDTPVAQRF